LPYSARQSTEHGISVVRLADPDHGVEVAIARSFGNRAFEITVHGANILHFPFADVSGLKTDPRSLNGIPFLAPWANRVAGGAIHANGKTFPFNESTGTLRLDSNGLPIHGMLSASPLWELVAAKSDVDAAWVTSRLEFWQHPSLMANWPFAHEYEMTHRLSGGILEVRTTILSRCAEPMPVAIGFHPYFNLPGVQRDDAVAHIPVRSHIETDSRLVATGETTPVTFAAEAPLKDHRFDDGYTDIQSPVFYVEGAGKRIEVVFGRKYQVAVVFAPPGQNYICFEPMAAITNGINLAAEGKYSALQWIEPGGIWTESFQVSSRGL
jgi:aldose 1-epimerase